MSGWTLDEIVLLGIQLTLMSTAAYGMSRDALARTLPGALRGSGIERGPGSMNRLHGTFVLVSALVIGLLSLTEAFKDKKLFLGTADIVALAYLIYFNGWGRQRVFGMIGKVAILQEPIQ